MHLRDYQKHVFAAAIEALEQNIMRSTYVAATGAGKTVVFQSVIDHLFKIRPAQKVLIVHPRIALSSDQQKRFARQFEVPFTSFHSGGVAQTTTRKSKVNVVNKSTTNRIQLEEILSEQKDNDHIVFTSYKSLHKIADMKWDLIICDEAHYLVTREFAQNLDLFTSPVMFFTATPIHKLGADDISMDNIEKFGKISVDVKPRELIERGYLAMPRLFFTKISTDKSGDHEDLVKSIIYTYIDQNKYVDKTIPHKMLVAMPDTIAFSNIMSRIADFRAAISHDLDLYAITAGTSMRNGSYIASREEALKQFDESTRPSIIIHCDTLAEGIDISGLTGAYIMRGLSQAKFIQTIGRTLRPWKGDLTAAFEPKAYNLRKKKFGFINIAVVDEEIRSDPKTLQWFKTLIDGGFCETSEDVNSVFGGSDKDDIVDLHEKTMSKIIDWEFEEQIIGNEKELDWK
jgi:superfamily II DNA or RNA helicase